MKKPTNYEDWNNLVKPYGWAIVTKKSEKLKIVIIILLSTLLFAAIAFASVYLFMLSNGKLNSDVVVAPSFPINTTFIDAGVTDNLYQVDVPTSNSFNIYLNLNDLECITTNSSG